MRQLRLIGKLDHTFGWRDGALWDSTLCDPIAALPHDLSGAVACVAEGAAGCYRLLRDPLGINKLFWSAADDGTVVVAARPRRLVDAGHPFVNIRAIPPGTLVELDLSRACSRVHALRTEGDKRAAQDRPGAVESLAQEIRAVLERACAELAAAYPGARAFVCLSGGLDSTGVAVLAREHFPDVVAVSFDLRRRLGPPSEDRLTAERLARDLGLPLLCVTVTEGELLELIHTVLVEAVDWRDFNVHAALVNASLARAITAEVPEGGGAQPLVLTGDLVNEFLVDYHEETYGGRVYYRLPRLPLAALRAFLVRSLETSHREVGPFEACGLPVVQLYAAAADRYLRLPAAFLSEPDRKDRLSRLVFGNRIPDYVYARPKTRAQAGDADPGRGVLGVCVRHGLDEPWLRRCFADLHAVDELGALDRFIRGGRYRAGVPGAVGAGEQP